MTYITVSSGKLGGMVVPSPPLADVTLMRVALGKQYSLGTNHHRMFPLAMVGLLAVALVVNPTAHAQDASTASIIQ
jgi:hypothetical protein